MKSLRSTITCRKNFLVQLFSTRSNIRKLNPWLEETWDVTLGKVTLVTQIFLEMGSVSSLLRVKTEVFSLSFTRPCKTMSVHRKIILGCCHCHFLPDKQINLFISSHIWFNPVVYLLPDKWEKQSLSKPSVNLAWTKHCGIVGMCSTFQEECSIVFRIQLQFYAEILSRKWCKKSQNVYHQWWQQCSVTKISLCWAPLPTLCHHNNTAAQTRGLFFFWINLKFIKMVRFPQCSLHSVATKDEISFQKYREQLVSCGKCIFFIWGLCLLVYLSGSCAFSTLVWCSHSIVFLKGETYRSICPIRWKSRILYTHNRQTTGASQTIITNNKAKRIWVLLFFNMAPMLFFDCLFHVILWGESANSSRQEHRSHFVVNMNTNSTKKALGWFKYLWGLSPCQNVWEFISKLNLWWVSFALCFNRTNKLWNVTKLKV